MTPRPVQWVTFGDGSTPTALFLWHIHHFGRRHRDDLGRVLYRRRSDDCKLVGEFSSREEVDAAAERKRGYPGFGDEPDCFFVTEYPWTPIRGRTASCLRNRPARPLQTAARSEAGSVR